MPVSKKSERQGTESSTAFRKGGLSLLVTCKLEKSDYIAGAPIGVDFSVTNDSPHRIFYAAGETWGRPAYIKFSACLQPAGPELRDPYPTAGSDAQGPMTMIKLEPAETSTRAIILNQFVALEDARAVLASGRSAGLDIRWSAYIQAVRKPDERLGNAEQVGGNLHATLTRDDEDLQKSVESLADRLVCDWQAVSSDPVGRRYAILALASLRIPEASPYLLRLTGFPELEVRRWAQYALSELQK